MLQVIDMLSTWNVIRLSGFLAFFYMTISVCFGMLASMKSMKTTKGLFHAVHLTSGWIGFLTIVFHAIFVWKNEYIPYTFSEITIPFISIHEPISSGLGILSLYLFLFILLSSDFWLKLLKLSVWKTIHILVYPAWLLMLVHGIWIGSDSTSPWALVIYGGSFTLTFFLLGLKMNEMLTTKKETKQKQVSMNKT